MTPRTENPNQSRHKGGLSPINESDVAHMADVDDSLRFKESEEQKRHFYTLAIHNSKKMLKTIPQGSVFKQLYRKALVRPLVIDGL